MSYGPFPDPPGLPIPALMRFARTLPMELEGVIGMGNEFNAKFESGQHITTEDFAGTIEVTAREIRLKCELHGHPDIALIQARDNLDGEPPERQKALEQLATQRLPLIEARLQTLETMIQRGGLDSWRIKWPSAHPEIYLMQELVKDAKAEIMYQKEIIRLVNM